MRSIGSVTALLLLLIQAVFSQQLVINEVMSSNATTLSDEDGDYPDWIELFNGSAQALNLSDYALTDDEANPEKWVFPDMSLEADEHLIVFASGKDRSDPTHWWETVVDRGDTCAYLVVHAAYPADWKNTGFDDSAWPTGPTGLGYGDDDDATIVDKTVCLYARSSFYIDHPADISRIVLQIDFDDAFVAYLNGTEVARANIGQAQVPPAFDAYPDEPREAQMYQGGAPLTFDLDAFKSLLVPGKNVLAIEVHNYGIGSSDLSLIPFLSFGYADKPNPSRGANPVLHLPVSGLHTNFKIKSSGETLVLTDPDGLTVDRFEADSIPSDISKGRYPDGTDNWFFFDRPTPADSNRQDGYEGMAPGVHFSRLGGMYDNFFFVSLSADNNAKIYYTTDGSEPTEASALYTFPIRIDKTTVLRSRALLSQSLPGPVGTETYFINESGSLPVISLSTTPANLWDEDSGIYVKGKNASPDFPYFGANFWQDWERPAHIEFFDGSGRKKFAAGCGIKIFGSYSRGLPQKSLAFFFRARYGDSELNYPLIPQTGIRTYESFVMRNSGNDWLVTMFRDGLMQTLVQNMDIDRHGFLPAVLFINGAYWGIQNIREKINEHYIASHYGFSGEQIDMLEYDGQVIHGDNEAYLQLIDYISTHDMNHSAAEEYILKTMDLDEYLDYEISEIYFDNTDWPGNNIKYWRPKTETGKWRWILYDTDFGFGLFDTEAYKHNTLDFALDDQGPDWPNPPWSTLLFRKILENDRFRQRFITRFQDHLNLTFNAARVKSVISDLRTSYLPEIDRHLTRWYGSRSQWDAEVERLNKFAEQRVSYMRRFLQERFGLNGYQLLSIQLPEDSAGYIELNGHLKIRESGNYFYSGGQTVSLIARANPGYRFTGWQGTITVPDDSISFQLNQAVQLNAQFTAVAEDSVRIVINEINYNSSTDFDSGDWVELTNAGTQNVDLTHWIFKDSNDSHRFTFPEGFVLKKDSFVVLVNDHNKFIQSYPNVSNYLSGMDFAFSGSGELLRLFDDAGKLADYVEYDDHAPWPEEADGNGATLELLNPHRQNANAENWAASAGHGTPGRINSVFTGLEPHQSPKAPLAFELEQNYPNPFNPLTTIKYTVTTQDFGTVPVQLIVYNALGQQVCTLVNRKQTSGTYSVRFNGEEMASGIYFYQLKSGKRSKIKKMILLR